MTAEEREEQTKVPCPACDGAGFIVEDVSPSTHRGHICRTCMGARIVTVEELSAWKLAHPRR